MRCLLLRASLDHLLHGASLLLRACLLHRQILLHRACLRGSSWPFLLQFTLRALKQAPLRGCCREVNIIQLIRLASFVSKWKRSHCTKNVTECLKTERLELLWKHAIAISKTHVFHSLQAIMWYALSSWRSWGGDFGLRAWVSNESVQTLLDGTAAETMWHSVFASFPGKIELSQHCSWNNNESRANSWWFESGNISSRFNTNNISSITAVAASLRAAAHEPAITSKTQSAFLHGGT